MRLVVENAMVAYSPRLKILIEYGKLKARSNYATPAQPLAADDLAYASIQPLSCRFPDGCHGWAIRARRQASGKRRGTKSRGAGRDGGGNLSAGYGDCVRGPAETNAQIACASG